MAIMLSGYGPQEQTDIQPFPAAIALLRRLGSDFNDKCASC